MDEDYAEPFEIIETADCEKLMKKISPLKQNNSRLTSSHLNSYLDKNIKNSQKSSFCEGDFFNPKGAQAQSNQASKASLTNLQMMKDIEFKGKFSF